MVEVSLPKSLTVIEDGAFSICRSLISARFLGDAPQLGSSVFTDNADIFSVYVFENASGFGDPPWERYRPIVLPKPADPELLEFDQISPDEIRITGYPTDEGGVLTIPPTIDGKRVVVIERGAFRGCRLLTRVKFPDGIFYIEDEAFQECSGLKRVDFSGNAPGLGHDVFIGTGREFKIHFRETAGGFDRPFWEGYPAVTAADPSRFEFHDSGLPGAIRVTGYPNREVGSLTIPTMINGKYVREIDSFAFREFRSLVSVEIPEGVTLIDYEAFEGCTALSELSLPGTLELIKDRVFHGCSQLASVRIPERVIFIGDSAFEGCSALERAQFLGEMAPGLGEAVFNNTADGFAVYFYDTANGFGQPFWRDYPAAEAADPKWFNHENLGHGKVRITGYPNHLVAGLSIPAYIDGDLVTEIGFAAFENFPFLSYTEIPDAVTEIDHFAFRDCAALSSIRFPDGLTHIGDLAFSGCSGLTSVTFPAGVEFIGFRAFADCADLENALFLGDAPDLNADVFLNAAEDFVVTFYENTFGFDTPFWRGYPTLLLGDPALLDYFQVGPNEIAISHYPNPEVGSLEIPAMIGGLTVTMIAGGAFHDFNLVRVKLPEGIVSIDSGAFLGCEKLASVNFPVGLEYIGSHAFSGTGLTSVALPDGINRIDDGTFSRCEDLVEISIPPSVQFIEREAFSECPRLEKVTFSEGLRVISSFAFGQCGNLVGITFPQSVWGIEHGAFLNCGKLIGATFLGDAPMMDPDSFRDCDPLFALYYAEGAEGFDRMYPDEPPAFPSGDTSAFTFESREMGRTVTGYSGDDKDVLIPGMLDDMPVVGLEDSAFTGRSDIRRISIPPPVSTIGSEVFKDCTDLERITFRGNEPSVEGGQLAGLFGRINIVSFSGREGFEEDLWNGSPVFKHDPSEFGYDGDSVTRYHGSETSIIIPETSFDGDRIRRIGAGAFVGAPGLKGVLFSDGIVEIENEAFAHAPDLESIILPEGLLSIGRRAFFRCQALKAIRIPAGVTEIGEAAFAACSSLEEFDVAAANERFGSDDGVLFSGDGTVLESYPGGKTGNYEIPASVNVVGRYSFHGTEKLRTVTVPASVTEIGDEAFQNCPSFQGVFFLGDAPLMGFDVFEYSGSGELVFFTDGVSGFTQPTWMGYPSAAISGATVPKVSWLVSNRFPHDSNIEEDPDGDGVSLLMAYALNLEPRENLAGKVPVAEVSDESVSLDFYAATPGIRYRVEASKDLKTWTTEGIVVSGFDENSRRRATIVRDGKTCFVRLVVEE